MEEHITLNVGGTIYTTTRTTLTTAEPNSMLACLCHLDGSRATRHTSSNTATVPGGHGTDDAGAELGSAAAVPAARRDSAGNIVIDRDGPSFRHVLNYLRDGRQCVLPGSMYELQQLHREASYFMLEGLMQLAVSAKQ